MCCTTRSTTRRLTIPEPANSRANGRVHGDPEQIDRALKLLAGAESPVIIAAGGNALAERRGCTLRFCGGNGDTLFLKGGDVNAITRPHPLFFGMASTRFGNASKELCNADVVLALGVKFDTNISYGKPPLFHEDAKFICVDIDAEEMGKNRPFDVGIIGDLQPVPE